MILLFNYLELHYKLHIHKAQWGTLMTNICYGSDVWCWCFFFFILHWKVQRTCGENVTANNTYFVNQNYPRSVNSPGSCQLVIYKCTPDICQLRWVKWTVLVITSYFHYTDIPIWYISSLTIQWLREKKKGWQVTKTIWCTWLAFEDDH